MRHLLLIITLLLAACSSALQTVSPYKMEITQGNIVTSKMLSQLKLGMSKSQVKFIVGTPLIQDMFHKDRWDYYLQQMIDGKITEQRRVIIDFKDDKLINVSGDVIAIESGDINGVSTSTNSGYKFTKEDPQVISKTQPTAGLKGDEQSFADKIMFWKEKKTDAEKVALKKQIDAHNQSVFGKQEESNSQATTTDMRLTTNTAAVDNNDKNKTMGKVSDSTAKNEVKESANKVKLGNKAAPISNISIPGASIVTPPLVASPVVTISANAPKTVPVTPEETTTNTTEFKAVKTLPIEINNEMHPSTTESVAMTNTPTLPMKIDMPIEEALQTKSTESMFGEGLLLSKNLEKHLDLPLNNPFRILKPLSLGLRLSTLMTITSADMIENTIFKNNKKTDEDNKIDERVKKTPSLFERMLEHVGF